MRSRFLTDMSAAGTADAYALLRTILAKLGSGDRAIEDQAEQIARELDVDDASLWEQLAGESDYHGVTLLIEPVVAAVLRITPSAIPDSARRSFFALASRHCQAAVARESCIDRLITAFAAAD